MKITAIVTSALLAGLLVSSDTIAQRRGPAGARAYDPKTVETIMGTVERLDRVPSPSRRATGVHLLVKTDKETVPVRLGPSWYVDKQEVKIERGDRVEVTGSRVTAGGKAVVIAADVKKGDRVLHLRDGSGVPRWSGAGGR